MQNAYNGAIRELIRVYFFFHVPIVQPYIFSTRIKCNQSNGNIHFQAKSGDHEILHFGCKRKRKQAITQFTTTSW